jgi:hypothetical protein
MKLAGESMEIYVSEIIFKYYNISNEKLIIESRV